MEYVEIILTSVISSGVVGAIFAFIFSKRLENHKQELNKELQRYSLFEQEKHKIYKEHYKIMMEAQSSVRLKVNQEILEAQSNLREMNNHLMKLNNHLVYNALYFPNNLYLKLEKIKKILVDLVYLKNKIYKEKLENDESLKDRISKNVSLLEKELELIKIEFKNEIES